MALTRLGWDVITSGSSKNLKSLSWITGKVRAGDAYTILDELGRRFNAEVETITKAHSWGYANRPVRGASVVSEHAAGTAVDFNAPAHPLGRAGTFSSAKVRAIRRILADLDGVVRWGGDYAGRRDEMHFELQGGVDKLAAVAAKIKNGGATVKPAGDTSKPASSGGGSLVDWLKARGRDSSYSARKTLAARHGIRGYKGTAAQNTALLSKLKAAAARPAPAGPRALDKGDKGADVKRLQAGLNRVFPAYSRLAEDGVFGNKTRAVVKEFQRRTGLVRDGIVGPKTRATLKRYSITV